MPRISAGLVRVAAGTDNSEKIDAFLTEVSQGGPVFMDRYTGRYYVLVPASTGQRREWTSRRDPEAEFLGRGCFLGVPRTDATMPERVRSYWCVPMDVPAPSPSRMRCLSSAGSPGFGGRRRRGKPMYHEGAPIRAAEEGDRDGCSDG
ncbi:hypothetical protein AB0I77_50375 [Streptomyces sp. NPDC050619]|uniref:hypothetical protein n=1 Tax=Streptomyces sp. NPDC050619 TaxID=3157214 RepID=UPI003439DE67